jgi:hypothetical protein
MASYGVLRDLKRNIERISFENIKIIVIIDKEIQ